MIPDILQVSILSSSMAILFSNTMTLIESIIFSTLDTITGNTSLPGIQLAASSTVESVLLARMGRSSSDPPSASRANQAPFQWKWVPSTAPPARAVHSGSTLQMQAQQSAHCAGRESTPTPPLQQQSLPACPVGWEGIQQRRAPHPSPRAWTALLDTTTPLQQLLLVQPVGLASTPTLPVP